MGIDGLQEMFEVSNVSLYSSHVIVDPSQLEQAGNSWGGECISYNLGIHMLKPQ
jgi:hypothetical protein